MTQTLDSRAAPVAASAEPAADPASLNIAGTRTTAGMRRVAALIALILVVAAGAVFPYAHVAMPEIAPFLPIFATCVFLIEGLTAYLLTIQFLNTRVLSIGVLAVAYGFTGLIVILQLLVFPGVFSTNGLLDAGRQSAVWLWAVWHGVFPTLVVVAMLVHVWARDHLWLDQVDGRLIWATLGVPVVMALVAAYFFVVRADQLPVLLAGNSYASLLDSAPGRYAVLAHIAALAAVLWVGRGRNVLHLWLAVAVLASLLDVGLTLAAGARYSLGWYASRCMSGLAGMSVLGVTLWEITRLYKRLADANHLLQGMATRDGLTGIRNRRYFDGALDEELARARRLKRPLSLILMDIDFFKLYNDAYGHVRGDTCLVSVAHTLDGFARRAGDTAARYGGEEFVLILANADAVAAAEVAENLRRAIEELGIPAAPNPANRAWVTVSVGVVTWPGVPPTGPSELTQAADAALYQAKAGGRNRIVSAPLPMGLPKAEEAVLA